MYPFEGVRPLTFGIYYACPLTSVDAAGYDKNKSAEGANRQ